MRGQLEEDIAISRGNETIRETQRDIPLNGRPQLMEDIYGREIEEQREEYS